MNLEQFLQPLAGLSHGTLSALAITFAGGILASAVCPCTLPMGLGVAGLASASESRLRYGGLKSGRRRCGSIPRPTSGSTRLCSCARGREGQQAMAEYQAELRAMRERTARLRALRLAHDAGLRSPIAIPLIWCGQDGASQDGASREW